MKCNSVIQYLVPMANINCKKTCKKTYTGVSIKLNQNRYNTKKLFGESIRTSEFPLGTGHFNPFEKLREKYVEQNVYG